MPNLIYLKLGGSVITDKTRQETPRLEVIRRIAREIRTAQKINPSLSLLLGHGSGSFGHFVAKQSRFGEPGNWRAFAETGASAARLDRLVGDILLEEGVAVATFQPSASARCRDGELVSLTIETIRAALEHGLVPMVYGDVAWDETREMTILSTEMLFAYLASYHTPTRVVLAGLVEGVYSADPLQDQSAQLIREITPATYAIIERQLRGSHGFDVTGGMLTKVKTMLALVASEPSITVHLVSGMQEGVIERALTEADFRGGTVIHA